ncbi:tyrosine-protein phosphatase vhp-1 [Ditylenchus destructor]|nr:tyrosine-protein phosphatase vhp-1 [Ditylenchus destructor]
MCYQKIGMQEATRVVVNEAHEIGPELLADYLKRQKVEKSTNPLQRLPSLLDGLEANEKCLIVDCRSFIHYNNSHVRSAINAFYSKIMRRRLLDNKTCSDFILNHLSHGLGDSVESDNVDLILYAGDDSTRLTNSLSTANENTNDKCLCAKSQNTKENCISEKEMSDTEPRFLNSRLTKPIDNRNNQRNEASDIQNATENGFSACSCHQSLTLSSSERFIRFLFEKLKDSTKLKFRRIMLLKGWLFCMCFKDM